MGFILPHVRYFLNRLRCLLNNCSKYGAQPWSPSAKANVILWKDFLLQAENGISINLISYSSYDTIIFTDACELGLGGFNPHTGHVWRYKLPTWAQSLHINVLEYLASFTGIYIELQNSSIQHHRILCMTDNICTLA